MKTNTTMEIEPMVYKIGNDGSLLSFTGAAEALVDMENCKNVADMEEALARVKENYETAMDNLPQLLEYEAEDKRKIQDLFWSLGNVKRFLKGVQVVR